MVKTSTDLLNRPSRSIFMGLSGTYALSMTGPNKYVFAGAVRISSALAATSVFSSTWRASCKLLTLSMERNFSSVLSTGTEVGSMNGLCGIACENGVVCSELSPP